MRWSVVAITLLLAAACGGDNPSSNALATATQAFTPGQSAVAGSTHPVVAGVTEPDHTATPKFDDNTWHPDVHPSWQWHLSDLPVDQSVDATMYDIDLFDNDASVVAELQAAGRLVVCYLSAGSFEDWRPDNEQFPEEVLGNDLDGWEGERWLDIRNIDLIGPVMEARLDLCKDKGFDAVEPDNIDGYLHDSGFPLTYDDQLAYNRWLADAAHARGLAIALKNDGDQIADLLDWYDFAIVEECYEYEACELWQPFVAAGKAVFIAEYALTTDEFCDQANAANYSAILKNLDLDARRKPCR